MKRGFSLVELSIVLVILGLLVGGILAGQSLIRAAELRKTIGFYGEMHTKFRAFQDKYLGFPGDLSNASSFWPAATSGNGNGHISWTSPAENFQVPYHLYLAGVDNVRLYANAAYGASPYWGTPGMKNGTLSFVGAGTSTATWADLYANTPPSGTLVRGIALQTATLVSSTVTGAAATAEETWQFDTKMDDGLPTTGSFLAFNGVDPSAVLQSCLTASAPYTYNLSNTAISCRFLQFLVR